MTIFIRFEGISAAVGTLKNVPENLARLVILDMSQVAYDSAEAGAERHSKTGRMLASLVNRSTPGGRIVGHVDPNDEGTRRAMFVNFGTRPHVIVPKDRKALRWASGGNFFFAKKVNHPGTRADAYMTAAATDALRQFTAIVDRRFREAAQ